MKVPLIMYLPAQEPLMESAARARDQAPVGILSETNLPDGFEVDRTFSAIPVGSADPGLETMESVEPQNSNLFAVRGSIEVDSLDEVPAEHNGAAIFADPRIEPFLTCIGDPPVGDHRDVGTQLDVQTLHAAGLDGDGVAVAILDTGINLPHLRNQLGRVPRFDTTNSWTPPNTTTAPGNHPVGHGTMCAFDALIAAPKATLLDFPILASTAPGGSAMAQSLSVALLGFAQLIAFWGVAFAGGGAQRYEALVVNNSWGMFHPSWDFPAGHPGRYADNPQHPFNVIVGTLARANADILFAAGNCAADCPDGRCQGQSTNTITGANALAEVLTVAGCDIHDSRVGYSSQGPAIAGMGNNKPDITAYTHFLGSEAYGKGSPDGGTSTACPVAAGCVAALRSRIAPHTTPPQNLIDQLNAMARQTQGTGWNGDYGHGIIDPVATAQSIGAI